VEVDAEAYPRAELVVHLGELGDRGVDGARRVEHRELFGAVHLEGVEAAFHEALHVLDDGRWPIPADPAVDLDAVAHLAAEQLVDRHAERLALDVPERLVDAGDRTHQDRAASVEIAAVHRLPEVVDARRVLPDQLAGELLHGCLDGARAAFDDRLAPAADAFVGLDLQEHPPRSDAVGREAGDLHAVASR
jgi:hypothetical protein